MSYSSWGYGSSSRSSPSRGSDKKKKKKIKPGELIYFIIGILAYPFVMKYFSPDQQLEFGKNVLSAVILGASALVGSIFSHRTLGIVDKFSSVKEYGKFFLVFMVVFAVANGYLTNNYQNIKGLYVMLISYALATFIGVYATAPKKAPKKEIAILTLIVGYILYAGVSSIFKL